MPKNFFAFLFFVLFTPFSYAETCPTIAEIKSHIFRNWQVVNLDSAEPLSEKDLNQFILDVDQFAFATWMPDAPEGASHCHYYGKIPSPDYLGVYLTKEAGAPDEASGNWYRAGPDYMMCKKNIAECRFM